MSSFTISTDTTADLPDSFLQEHNIPVMSLSYTIDDVTYDRAHPLDVTMFYQKMRSGSMPTTSQVTPEIARDCFESILATGETQILHIAFSSGLSGTYNSAAVAARELMEEHPEVTIHVVDTLAASLGEGFLVYKAIQERTAGRSFEETYAFLEKYKKNACHLFTVDDLFHLHRGGRVSRATAIVGTMINIKPVLHVDDEGHLINIDKARGRKKSIRDLADKMIERLEGCPLENDCFFISHGDCLEDAHYLADLIESRTRLKLGIINHVGPTIGSHSGPGTLALFFWGSHR